MYYDYDVWSTGGTLIRHLNLKENLEFGATYFVETYRKSEFQTLENPPGPEGLTTPKLLFKSKIASDHLDYHYHYLEGYSWTVLLQNIYNTCLLYTSPSPRDQRGSRMPSSA